MTIEDLKDILYAIKEEREVKIPYQIHDDIRDIIDAFSGPVDAYAAIKAISLAQPAEFKKK